MPANIAHILISHKISNRLEADHAAIHEVVKSKINHFYLGALGPDLPSYKTSNMIRTALEQLLVRPFVSEKNPQEEDASFFLHSTRPNLFPWYLMETNLSYAPIEDGKLILKDFNVAVFAFTLGYVTHIAADQVIHRLVSELVGPYYRSLETSRRHAECEVNQDIFLFHELYPGRIFNKNIHKDLVNIDKFGFEYDHFCNMMALAVSKAGYRQIEREDIDGWLDGIRLAMDLMDNIGPYVSALRNYEEQQDNLANFPFYKRYFRNADSGLDYMDHFNKAVELGVKYCAALISLWKKRIFSYDNFVEYQQAVQPDDLTSPLRVL